MTSRVGRPFVVPARKVVAFRSLEKLSRSGECRPRVTFARIRFDSTETTTRRSVNHHIFQSRIGNSRVTHIERSTHTGSDPHPLLSSHDPSKVRPSLFSFLFLPSNVAPIYIRR